MLNQDRLDVIQREREAAENSLNEAIRELEQLGIHIEISEDQYCECDSSSYSEKLMNALKKYINAKNKLNTFL